MPFTTATVAGVRVRPVQVSNARGFVVLYAMQAEPVLELRAVPDVLGESAVSTNPHTKALQIERVEHRVLENKLLASLDDGDHVALVLSRRELSMIIQSVEAMANHDCYAVMLVGFKVLRDKAFGGE